MQTLDGLEERVLSSLPDDQATTAKKLAARLKLSPTQVEATIARLAADGLVQPSGEISGEVLYRLTTAGVAHFQRDRSSRPADLPSFRSSPTGSAWCSIIWPRTGRTEPSPSLGSSRSPPHPPTPSCSTSSGADL